MKIVSTLILILLSFAASAQSWLDDKCPDLDVEVNVVDFETSKERNVLDILINQSDEIVINGEVKPRLNLEIPFKEYVLEFVTNPNNQNTKAESPSKVFIKLYSYNKTSTKLDKFDIYIKEVYLYIWNSEADAKYQLAYGDLSCKRRAKIASEFPLRIVSEETKKNLNKPPSNRIGLPPFGGDVKKE